MGKKCKVKISPADKRANRVYLMDKGKTEVAGLIETTNQDIYDLVEEFDMDICGQICDARGKVGMPDEPYGLLLK